MPVSSALQSGLRVAITLTGLPVLPAAGQPQASPWTLYRSDGSTEVVVRGAVRRTLGTGSSTVVIDREAPIGRPFLYTLRYVTAAGAQVAESSGWLTQVQRLPVLSDPLGETLVPVTIDDWPTRTRKARGTSFDVDGRDRSIYIVSARMSGASGSVLLRTDTTADAAAAEGIIITGRSLLLRTPKAGVPDRYLWPDGYEQTRASKNPDDPVRYHQLNVIEVDMPEPTVPSAGDTLADLAVAVPTTLLGLSQAFPTLLSIAQADLGGG